MNELVYGLYKNDVDDGLRSIADYAVKELFGKEKTAAVSLELSLDESEYPTKLSDEYIAELKGIVGDENVSTLACDRVAVSFSRRAIDVMTLQGGKLDEICDVVVYPSELTEIEGVVSYCDEKGISLYVYDGSYDERDEIINSGSVCIDLRRNYNRVVRFNEIDKTITVEAGMSMVRLQDILVHGRKYFKSLGGYTLSRFPVDFAYASVCDVALSDYSGDIIESQSGIELGYSELYVPTEVTFRISRCIYENRKPFAYLYNAFDEATFAARTIRQNECGSAATVFAYDEIATNLIFKAVGKACKKGQCLLFGYADGEKKYCAEIAKRATAYAEKLGGERVDGDFSCLLATNSKLLPFRDALLEKNVVLDAVSLPIKWSKLEETRRELLDSYEGVSDTKVITALSQCEDNEGILSVLFITDNDADDEAVE